jgi:invasion protein IalB
MSDFRQPPRAAADVVKLVLGCAVALALLAGSVDTALAQGVVKSVHKDWQIRCDTPPGAKKEQCSLVQSVIAPDYANVSMSVRVFKLADGQGERVDIVAPLGILVPGGLTIGIDGVNLGMAGFTRCLAGGCMAEVSRNPDLIEKLKNGKIVTFTFYFRSPQDPMTLPMSLDGFREGYANLK